LKFDLCISAQGKKKHKKYVHNVSEARGMPGIFIGVQLDYLKCQLNMLKEKLFASVTKPMILAKGCS
jgi:hypothetical protein